MVHRRVASTVVFAVAALVTAVLLAPRPTSPDLYAGFRQARDQEIPGTFGYVLSAPGDITPTIDPVSAYGTLLGSRSDRDVALTLATVRNDADGVRWGPAWVYLTRDLCYFSAKGDFVSPSRAGDDDGCTADNLLVQVVDASSGDFVAAFDAYDPGKGWSPDRGGAPIQTLGATRFH